MHIPPWYWFSRFGVDVGGFFLCAITPVQGEREFESSSFYPRLRGLHVTAPKLVKPERFTPAPAGIQGWRGRFVAIISFLHTPVRSPWEPSLWSFGWSLRSLCGTVAIDMVPSSDITVDTVGADLASPVRSSSSSAGVESATWGAWGVGAGEAGTWTRCLGAVFVWLFWVAF